MSRIVYNNNMLKLHKMIHTFIQGETAYNWIKIIENKWYDWVNFKALQTQYGGGGKNVYGSKNQSYW